tara:strand:+ start:581 stop:2512 length:1932 start_codon:yes stop_codon:yes gene_type:complete
MALVNFANLDFNQIKSTLKEYLRNNSNFTDYDFEGSNLATILDVLAYNTYITSYNANMVSNECFIDSATLRENVVALARNIGYTPRSRKASVAFVSFFVDTDGITPAPVSITLNKGPVATSAGTFGNESFVFSILDDITVPVVDGIASFDLLALYEGTYLTESYTYNSRNPNQRFLINNVGVDTDQIRVSVRTNSGTERKTYTRQDSLFEIDGESRVFFLQEVEDERYEIIFGDGTFGKELSEGNIIDIDYLTTTGGDSNGVSSFAFNGRLTYVRNGVTYTATQGISLITTDIASDGGDVIEKVDSIKKFAPRIYASQNRALTANDYETLIPAKIYPETESISVFGGEELVPPQYGKVFISIKPRSGEFLPNLIKQNIKRDLKKYAVAGIVPEILDLKYLYLETTSKVYYNQNQAPSASEISSIIQNNANEYADSSEMNKYGARFKYSKFLKLIDDSHESITSNITSVSMRRDVRAALNQLAEYSIGFGNQFHIASMQGFNIRSSAFRVAGITRDVYLGDIPDTNRTSGSLFFFTVDNPSSTSPTIIRRNVGRIDYVNGIITLFPVNVQSTQKIIDGQATIQVSATPSSNDVVGLQDLYLQLDVNNSIFEMVNDTIASGLDPSASSYTVSSSYDFNRGLLVRS